MKSRAINYIAAGLLALGSWAYSGDSEVKTGRMSREDWQIELKNARESQIKQGLKLLNLELDRYFRDTREKRERRNPDAGPKRDYRRSPVNRIVYDRGNC